MTSATDPFDHVFWLASRSAGVLAWPQTHMEWVRPGIMLYGVSPFLDSTSPQERLMSVMTLTSRLIAINTFRRGDSIGYGGNWVCPEDMPVGVVAIGYGDGYPRSMAAGAPVLICSTDIDELASLCDRVIVLYQGQVSATLAGDSMSTHAVLEAMNTDVAA